jgi:PAS domain S-box-containing protein
MKLFLIALPPEWKERFRKILSRRGHSPRVMETFDEESEIFRGDELAIAVLHANGTAEDMLRFCRRLRDRRLSTKLKILICASIVPDKESWPAFERAGVDFVLPAVFNDAELEFRLSVAECLLLSTSPTGDAAPPPGADIAFTIDSENVPYGVFHSSLANKFLKVNDGLVQLLGYSSKEELLQVDLVRDIYFDPTERARLIATIPPQNRTLEVVWKRRDGTPVDLQLSGHWVVDEEQHTIYLQGIAWDITEQKRSRELLLLQRDLGIALSHASSLRQMLDILLDAAMQIKEVDCGGIYLVEPDTRIYRLASYRGFSPQGIEKVSVASTDLPLVRLCEEGNPIYVLDESFGPVVQEWSRAEGIKSQAILPIVHEGRVIASLSLGSRTREEFSRASQLALESIATQIGGSIARVQAEESLRTSENHYRLIAENASDVVWTARWLPPDPAEMPSEADPRTVVATLLRGWRFEYVSPSLEKVLGYGVEESMADTPISRMDPAWHPAVAKILLENLESPPPSQTFEFPMLAKDGALKWCEVTVNILSKMPDGSLRLMGILRDISARHAVQEALRKSEAQVRGLFEHLPDIVILCNQNAAIRFVNRTPPDVAADSVIGANAFSFLHESSQAESRAAFAQALSSNAVQTVEATDIFGVHWFSRIVPMVVDSAVDHVMIISTDLTAEKKAAQAVLREQQLLRRLIDLSERERKYLSYEIHDGFAQQITGALFHVEAYKRLREDDAPKAEKDLDYAVEMLRRSIDETRRLISGLRPPILDEAGILAAIDYLICEYREKSGIDIMFQHDLRAVRLAPPLESAIFRIVQESLANACRHSGSEFIRVELNDAAERLHVVVFDEGAGFEPAAVPEDRFGLRNLRERARLLGGAAEIQSAPGEGCRVCVELPLVPAASE